MQINIITLGKLKEKYLVQACGEYEKRLSPMCKLSIYELAPERLPENPNEKQIAIALEKEAMAISKLIKSGSFTISLCIEGGQTSSENFAKTIQDVSIRGIDTVNFVIGSSHGICDSIKLASDMKLSFSKMTFPHQLARVMLLEQIYRGFSIIKGTKYHK